MNLRKTFNLGQHQGNHNQNGHYATINGDQAAPSGKWYPAKFEQSVVEHLVATQFETYCKKVQTSDCAAEMRRCVVSQADAPHNTRSLVLLSAAVADRWSRLPDRLMEKGPPVWVSDPHGLALPEGETHIQQLWFSSDGAERSAKLTGAVEGDERQVRH